MSNRSGEVASKSDVSYEDTKVTSEAIFEALHGSHSHEAERPSTEPSESPSSDYPAELRDSDYRERSGEDAEKDELDYRECRDAEKGEAYCENEALSNPGKSKRTQAENPDIRDPLMAHELFVPYSDIPNPRIFHIVGNHYVVTSLPRRPRSPVRHILPGRFDLSARITELIKRQGISNARRYLWQFKNRIAESVKQISYFGDIDFDLITCMLMLRALCEYVIVPIADTYMTEIDAHTFINMAIIWALTDLKILDPHTLNEEERSMLTELETRFKFPKPQSEMNEAISFSKLRRILFEVQRTKSKPHSLFHCLSWTLVGAAHQRGALKFYSTVRDRIDKIVPDPKCRKLIYVPDLTCFHFREVSEESCVKHYENIIQESL